MGNLSYVKQIMLIAAVLLVLSCERFEGDQTVPSYLHVDTIILESNPLLEEGYLTHNFTDVWVYVDDQIIGAFELPATIPILASGKRKVALYAGVILNGISGTRGNYLFTQPRIYDELELFIDSVITRNPRVSYFDNTQFLWLEDFEGTLSTKTTSNSDTTLEKFYRDEADEFLGLTSGMGVLDAEHPVWEVTSFDAESPGYVFPSGGQPVILEMEYNSENRLAVGIFVTRVGSGITQHPVVIFQASGGEWKKVYVNLTPSISAFNTNDFFNVFIRADIEEGLETPRILIDNLKLINRVAY
jgi:hypothetical protein